MTFSIGGVSVRLASVDPNLRLAAKGDLNRFLAPHASPRIHVRAAWGAVRATSGDQLFDSGSLWRMYRQGSGCVLDFRSPVFGEIPYKQALFNSNFTAGEIRLHAEYFDRDQPVFPLEAPLDEILFVNYLATGHGAEVHACGLIDADGTGRLFLGSSGAGKTTMARQWQKKDGIEILSDDRIILRCEDGKIWMYGTPWHGEARAASPKRVPVAQMFFLAKAPRNEAVSLRPAQAVARLVVTSFVPFHNAGALDYTLAFFEKAAHIVPIRELRFAPDERVVDYVRRLDP